MERDINLQPKQIISRLRYLADEYREARKLPPLQAFEHCLRLDGQAEKSVAMAWSANLLFGIQSLAELFDIVVTGDDWTDFDEWWFGTRAFNVLVGYDTFVDDERKKVVYPDDSDFFEESEDGNDPKWLLPGLLGGVFSELRPINGGLFDDVDLFTARTQCSFEVMGYKARACEIIADYAELEIEELAVTKSKQVKQPTAPAVMPVDPAAEYGLDRSKREFAWFGDRYERLTETMMDALQVLFRAYQQQRRVKPDEMENKIGNLPDGGFFKVFEVDRAGWEKVHPVRKIVGGRANTGWYLIEPNNSQT